MGLTSGERNTMIKNRYCEMTMLLSFRPVLLSVFLIIDCCNEFTVLFNTEEKCGTLRIECGNRPSLTTKFRVSYDAVSSVQSLRNITGDFLSIAVFFTKLSGFSLQNQRSGTNGTKDVSICEQETKFACGREYFFILNILERIYV